MIESCVICSIQEDEKYERHKADRRDKKLWEEYEKNPPIKNYDLFPFYKKQKSKEYGELSKRGREKAHQDYYGTNLSWS